MDIVTQRRLDIANYAVTNELDKLGFYDAPMQAVETYLVPVGRAYGWQYYGGTGHINIPRISIARLNDLWSGSYTSLRDVLRHEFGHAVADTHRGLFRSRRFSDSFGAAHNWNFEWEYDPDYHVTEGAATAPAEDFAEIFMCYLRHDGRLPARIATSPIRRRWRFVDELREAISNGDKRW